MGRTGKLKTAPASQPRMSWTRCRKQCFAGPAVIATKVSPTTQNPVGRMRESSVAFWVNLESASCCDDGWIEYSGKTCCAVTDCSVPAGKTPGIVCCGLGGCFRNMDDPAVE